MDEFELRNRINEIRSLIASNWPGIEERKRMYEELEKLESQLKIINTSCDSKNG